MEPMLKEHAVVFSCMCPSDLLAVTFTLILSSIPLAEMSTVPWSFRCGLRTHTYRKDKLMYIGMALIRTQHLDKYDGEKEEKEPQVAQKHKKHNISRTMYMYIHILLTMNFNMRANQ